MTRRAHWGRRPAVRAARLAVFGTLIWSVLVVGQSATASLRLYVLDCGTLKARDGVPYGLSLEQMAPRDLADMCALVVHPRGTLLWETGLHESVNVPGANGSSRPGGRRPGDRLTRTLKSQLEEIGYGPRDITYVALSHGHWDHTGNVRDYLKSTWLLQKAERDAILGPSRSPNATDFAGLETAPTRVLEGDHDVFGDGSVTLIFTPGHTAGHQALLVRLPKSGPVILSGDLYHFAEELTLKPTLTVRNEAQIAASKAKVQYLVATAGAELWIQHDMERYAALKKAPAFYD